EMGNEKMLKDVLDALVRAPAQLRVLMTAVRLFHLPDIDKTVRVKRSILLKEAGAGADALKQLERKGILHLVELEESRLSSVPQQGDEALKLTPVQRDALKQIKVGFKSGSPVLLHGVTSSGKTEVYIQLIDEALSMGKQVLYLLPEIALTSQIISRLQKYFGSKVGVYHSRFNQGEKVETWQNVLRGGEECSVILGARSAVFLPFQKLDLVIVDEEHDPSYKQQDPAPRYNGRDTAVMLATHCGAKVLLGSATPSVETYWNAQNDKYKLVQISERYGGIEMPEIIVTDLARAHKMKKMHAHFSEFLLEKIKSTLKQGKQVILFRNRRGFSPLLLCRTCGWIPKCANCDVSLTYHKNSNRLRCHYCGYSDPSPEKCLACGDSDLRLTGYGTEKTEEELQTLMPEARIARMDWDTTRGKYAHRKLITSFEEGRIDVLVGTQMVTKGLDFNHVGLVGVLHADHMLHFPDFRSYERSFQLMSQVAGRAGRKGERGLVVIQAFSPKHPVVEMVRNCDYIGMYKQEISDRKCFRYPPFHRLIRLTLRHRDFDAVNSTAETLAGMLKGAFGSRVLGPEFPPVARVRNQYNKHILVKLEYGISIANAKTGLLTILDRFRRNWQVKSVRIIIDVDPV
ncbi:MAG: primosomal protein N', partial [Flavobacteriales bacterium]